MTDQDSNARIASLVQQLLVELGENPTRAGLAQTPERVAKSYQYLVSGHATKLTDIVNGALFAEQVDEMVLVKDIEFYSLCEHHMLPFYGRAHIAYLPQGKIIGLSKLPRIVDMFAGVCRCKNV